MTGLFAATTPQLLGFDVDVWANLLVAAGTLALAVTTWCSLRELRAQRKDGAQPHLLLDVEWRNHDRMPIASRRGIRIVNAGGGFAYDIALLSHDGTAERPQWLIGWVAAVAPVQPVVVPGGVVEGSPAGEEDLALNAVRAYCRDSFNRWYRFQDDSVAPTGAEPRRFVSARRIRQPPRWVLERRLGGTDAGVVIGMRRA